MAHLDTISVKFCNKAAPDDKAECQKLVEKMLSSKGAESDKAMDELAELTGKSLEQIAEMMEDSCPLCVDD